MQYKNKTPIRRTKRPLMMAGAIVAFLIFATGVYWFGLRDTSSSHAPQSAAEIETELGREQSDNKSSEADKTPPPTSSTRNDASVNKDGSVSTPRTGSSVTPVITYAGYQDSSNQAVEVNAFVPGIFETGTCTLTLTQGTKTISKQVGAAGSATTTSCANFVIPKSEMGSSGEWSAVVKYNSGAHSGTSNVTKFKI